MGWYYPLNKKHQDLCIYCADSQSSGSEMPSYIDNARLVNVTLQENNWNETEPRNEVQHDKNNTIEYIPGLKDMRNEKSKVFMHIWTGRSL